MNLNESPDERPPAGRILAFGPFHYDPDRRVLLCGDSLVPLGGPESALLDRLIENPGALVGKDELAAAMWPSRTVAECNLRWQVASLRRRIGCSEETRFIATVSGRGYRLVAPVRHETPRPSAARADPWLRDDMAPLPPAVSRIFGREDQLCDLRLGLADQRLLTIVGPGGIGKTTVAVAAAHQWEGETQARALLVDLSGARNDEDVPALIAAALKLPLLVRDMTDAIVAKLRNRRTLLLLDSCEGALAGVAGVAARLLEANGDLRILATSREPLGCRSENIMRIGPLQQPTAAAVKNVAALRGYGATALFLDRFERDRMHRSGDFVRPEDAPDVSWICSRLGGHALAIELAAGQASALGIKGLVRFLNDRFLLAMTGGAGSPPRHRTLEHTFRWSYDLLSADQRHVLCRVSRFEGRFDLAAACFVAADLPPSSPPVPVLLAALVQKSLIVSEATAEGTCFHLLDPIRAFASDRLAERGDEGEAAALHAAWLLQALDASDDFASLTDAPRNIAGALDWAERSEENSGLLIDLTLAAVPLWNELSMLQECSYRSRRAIAVAERQGDDRAALRALYQALVGALAASGGSGADLGEAAARLTAHASATGHVEGILKGLWGHWVERHNGGEARDAVRLAQKFGAQVRESGLSAFEVTADRMLGLSLHLQGDQAAALDLLERTLPVFAWPERNRANLPYHFDQRIIVLAYRARAMLLAGRPDQALRMAASACAEAEDMRHLSSLAYALAIGHLPVALLSGRRELASGLADELRAIVEQIGVPSWKIKMRGLEGWVAACSGRMSIADINRALAAVHEVPFGPTQAAVLAALAQSAGRAGFPETGLDIVGSALDDCERTGMRWFEPELLRVRAELFVDSRERAGLADAQAMLDRAEAQALKQGAMLWVERIRASRPAFTV